MIRDLVLDAQTTEPAVRQVDLNLPAEQPLRTDGKNVADDEHPDHQHRVNRRAAARRVVGCKLSTHPGQIEHGGDLAHKVIARYHLVVPKLVEKLLLLVLQPPHHRSPPQRIVSERRNHRSQKPSTGFCNKICQKPTLTCEQIQNIRGRSCNDRYLAGTQRGRFHRLWTVSRVSEGRANAYRDATAPEAV